MYRPNGPRELWTEHLMSNPASFANTAPSTDSDDWLATAVYPMSPARAANAPTRTTDQTAYAASPAEDSWYGRYYGTLSPAKATAGAAGTTRGGQLT